MLSHRTPPRHGSAIIGDLVYEGLMDEKYNIYHINLSSASSIDDIGRVNLKKFKLLLSMTWEFISQLIKVSPDLIYITPTVSGSGFYKDFFFTIIAKAYRLFSGNDCRILYHIQMRPFKSDFLRSKIFFRIFFNQTELIFPSAKLLEDYNKDDVSANVVYALPNVVKPLCSRYLAYEKACEKGTGQDKAAPLKVLYFGHLIRSKGYKRALEVAKILSKTSNKFQFYFSGHFGSKDDKDYFENFIHINGLESFVIYNGPCSENDKFMVLMNSDVVIFPSYSEGYPLTILEAFSGGIPVVATDTGANSEIIDDKYGRVISFSGDEEKFVTEFANCVTEITELWTPDLAKECIDRFYATWNKDKFCLDLKSIMDNTTAKVNH